MEKWHDFINSIDTSIWSGLHVAILAHLYGTVKPYRMSERKGRIYRKESFCLLKKTSRNRNDLGT